MAVSRSSQDGVQPVIADEAAAVDHLQWKTEIVRLGVLGANLLKPQDALDPTELAILTNGVPRVGGGIQTRPGLANPIMAGGGVSVHSALRLNDPNDNASTIIWGVDQTLQRGDAGVLNNLAGGFSGKPLSLVSWQSENSGEPWMFVADSSRMAKVSRTSGVLPIGLTRAAQPTSVTPSAPLITDAAKFEAADGTDAAQWAAIAGTDADGNATLPPNLYDAAGITTSCVNMATVEGAATSGYFSGMSIPKVLNLNTLPGPVVSGDQDLIHFSLRINFPNKVQEVRLYFVVGAFTSGVIPGVTAGVNTSAYVRAFRSSDFSDFVAQAGTALSAESAQRAARILALQIQASRRADLNRQLNTEVANQQEEQLTQAEQQQQLQNIQAAFSPPTEAAADVVSSATLAGSDVWTSYGALNIPLRKSDFLKVGQAGQAGFTWGEITGIVITVLTKVADPLTLAFDELWLQGGYDPDTSEPDSQPYDYRVCNVDQTTGARSNPSNVLYQADGKTVAGVDTLRGSVVVQPQAYGSASVYQELYRRGGSLTDNWYGPVATNKNTGDGTPITDTTSDVTALATGAVEIDHDQPVTTADDAGNAVYGEPLTFLLGPIDGTLLGGGDRYRPGDLYWSKRGQPDHWPAFNHQQVCPPSETLMNGGMYGGQGFVFSRERLYAVQVYNEQVSTAPTDCAQGLVGRWAMAIGPGGIYFVSRDAVRVTTGGLSQPISDAIRPLFNPDVNPGPTNGYYPINFNQPDAIRLQVYGDDVWFTYLDTQGSRIWWVFSLLIKTWRAVIFSQGVGFVYADQPIAGTRRLLCGATTAGRAWEHTGSDDAGLEFNVSMKTGYLLAASREEKLFGDIVLYGDLQGEDFTTWTRINGDQVVNIPDQTTGTAGYREYLLHPFGAQPQHGSSISLEIGWHSGATNPVLVTQIGLALVPQPEISMQRATTWQPLNQTGEAYLYGAWIDCDTFGADLNVTVEGLLGGQPVGISSLVVNSAAGRRKWFDWPAVHVDMVRLRPADECGPWMLFGQGWLTRPEPARLPGMDSGFENLGDTYYTGLDLEIDTFNAAKTVVVEVDGVPLNDPATGLPWSITTQGRRLVHLTLPWGRGHIYRFYSNDLVPVLVYAHKWLVEAEPGEQTNWNQNFTIAGTHADKWLKGILLECDTFNQIKQVNVEIDGVNVAGGPFPVQTNGRRVVQIAFPQALGRVFRLWPADNFPGRLYSMGWIFDQEPYQLTRFETQEEPLQMDEWKVATYGQITYKSTGAVTFQQFAYGQDGQLLFTDTEILPSTGGVKAMRPYKPEANKGVLYKYIISAASGFWLYREESYVEFQPWQGGRATKVKPFGNDDLDPTRGMARADLAAQRPGGEA